MNGGTDMLEVCVGDSTRGIIMLGLDKGKAKVICTFYDLTQGPIPKLNFLQVRQRWVTEHYHWGKDEAKKMRWDIKRIIAHARRGGSVRFWLSSAAHVKCGIYATVSLLKDLPCKMYVIEMPQGSGFRDRDEECSWAEISPFSLPKALHLTRELAPDDISRISAEWEALQVQNAPLRVNENWTLTGVSTDYFDEEILSHVPADTECSMRAVVGNTLGLSKHCLSDSFVTERIYEMIDQDRLLLVKPSPKSYLSYDGATVRKP